MCKKQKISELKRFEHRSKSFICKSSNASFDELKIENQIFINL